MEAMFHATLPSIASAIRIHGDGGARIQLDVADSDLAEVLRLTLLRGELLRVTIVQADERLPFDEGNGQPPSEPMPLL